MCFHAPIFKIWLKRVGAHKIISSPFFFTVKLQTGKSVTRVTYREHCTWSCHFLILRGVHTVIGNEVYYFYFLCSCNSGTATQAARAQEVTYSGLACFNDLETYIFNTVWQQTPKWGGLRVSYEITYSN